MGATIWKFVLNILPYSMHSMNNHKTFDLFIKAIIMAYYTKPEFSFVTGT